MKKPNLYRVIGTLSAVLILAFVVTKSQRSVRAAPPPEGGIAGTVKLEGTAPHQRPIDMSKEPACAAVHKANPVTTENVVAGADGGLKNVVVYLSEGWSGSPEAATSTPTWDQKGCQYSPHVMGLDVNQHLLGNRNAKIIRVVQQGDESRRMIEAGEELGGRAVVVKDARLVS